jgi:hypothetical protein
LAGSKEGLRVSTLLLTLGLFAFVLASPAYASTVQQCNVAAGSQCTLTFNLNNGDSVSGSISVTGGSGNDVNFYISDPTGGQIYNAGRVSGGTSFSFTANSSGAYILHFDNSFSLLSSKQVTVSYDVSSSSGGIPEFPPQLSFAAIITLIVITSYLLVRQMSTRRGMQPVEVPHTGTAMRPTFIATD